MFQALRGHHEHLHRQRELVSTMQQIRIRRQKPRSEPWWCWIDTRTPSGRVLPF